MSERIEFIAPLGGLLIKNVLGKAGGVLKKMNRRRQGASPGGLPKPKLANPYGKQTKRPLSGKLQQKTENQLAQAQGNLKGYNKQMAATANDPLPKQKPSIMGELSGGHAAYRGNPKLAHGGFMGGIMGAGLAAGIPSMVSKKQGGMMGAVKKAGKSGVKPSYQSTIFPSTAFNPTRRFSALEDLIEF